MASKAPGAKVPKKTGQGVSRSSYQTGYRLGNRGSAAPGGAIKDASVADSGLTPGKTRGSKGGAVDEAGGMNISYGDTLPVSDLEDVKGYAKQPSAKKAGSFLKPGKGKLGLKLK